VTPRKPEYRSVLERRGIVSRLSLTPKGATSHGVAPRAHVLAPLLLALTLIASACGLLPEGGHFGGGASPPPSGSLSVSFIDVGQGDGVLVQAGGEDYLIDAGRAEEGPNVVDFLRSRGVGEELDGIVVTNPQFSQNTYA
jgi:hypothetical protein